MQSPEHASKRVTTEVYTQSEGILHKVEKHTHECGLHIKWSHRGANQSAKCVKCCVRDRIGFVFWNSTYTPSQGL